MEGGNPSTRKRGFSPSNHRRTCALLNLGLPQDPASQRGALLTEFSPKTRSLYSRRFYLSKAFLRLSWRVFCFQKYFRCFLNAISAFKSTFVASPARFWLSKALSCLPGVFSAFKSTFEASLDMFSPLKSTFVAFPARFRTSKILSCFPLCNFGFQKHFCGFPDTISGFKSIFGRSAMRAFRTVQTKIIIH